MDPRLEEPAATGQQRPAGTAKQKWRRQTATAATIRSATATATNPKNHSSAARTRRRRGRRNGAGGSAVGDCYWVAFFLLAAFTISAVRQEQQQQYYDYDHDQNGGGGVPHRAADVAVHHHPQQQQQKQQRIQPSSTQDHNGDDDDDDHTRSTAAGALVLPPPPEKGRAHRRRESSRGGNALLRCTGSFGLGHRLSKLAAAHRLAARDLRLPAVRVDWGRCPGGDNDSDGEGTDIFAHLFGTTELAVAPWWDDSDSSDSNNNNNSTAAAAAAAGETPIAMTTASSQNHKPQQQQQKPTNDNNNNNNNDSSEKVIWVRNDVHGYYAGQSYKNFAVPVTRAARSAWRDQLAGDAVLATALADRFWRQQRAGGGEQQQQQRWKDAYTVIGLHVRAGNGERDHFAAAGRGGPWRGAGEGNSSEGNSNSNRTRSGSNSATAAARILQRLVKRLVEYLRQQQQATSTFKPPLVFLATDTAAWIGILRDALKPIPVVVWEQPRVPPGQGVSYQAWANSNNNDNNSNSTNSSEQPLCLRGWTAAATDMFLLAAADVLIATARSTFTQIVPAALVFARSRSPLKFCEMDGPRLTCFGDRWTWLLRQQRRQRQPAATASMVTFAVDGADGDAVQVYDHGDDGDNKTVAAVTHKVMVHLPDVASGDGDDPIRTAALAFLADDDDDDDDRDGSGNNSNSNVFYYGRKFNRKYRDKKRPFRTDWVWADD